MSASGSDTGEERSGRRGAKSSEVSVQWLPPGPRGGSLPGAP